jgi:hypothetical protein
MKKNLNSLPFLPFKASTITELLSSNKRCCVVFSCDYGIHGAHIYAYVRLNSSYYILESSLHGYPQTVTKISFSNIQKHANSKRAKTSHPTTYLQFFEIPHNKILKHNCSEIKKIKYSHPILSHIQQQFIPD